MKTQDPFGFVGAIQVPNDKEIVKKAHKILFRKKAKGGCPVCRGGWKNYHGNYDELCTKHYLQAEPR